VTAFTIWLSLYIRGVLEQRDAADAIREFGGSVRYDFQYPSGSYDGRDFDPNAESSVPQWLLERIGVDFFHDVVEVNLGYRVGRGNFIEVNTHHSDEALQHLVGLPNLRVLTLDVGQASDDSMRYFQGIRRLERLCMAGADVGDEGVANLESLKRLRNVYISDARLTDKSMRVFARLPRLEVLSLEGNKFTDKALETIRGATGLTQLMIGEGDITVTDKGLGHLAGLKNLRVLGLQGSQITDAGLKHFEALPNLRELRVGGTQVTRRGADQFKKSKRRGVKFEGGGLRR